MGPWTMVVLESLMLDAEFSMMVVSSMHGVQGVWEPEQQNDDEELYI